MTMSPARWKAVTESAFAWEREALEYIRERLPDQEPYRAWANFEFIADDGTINEVDLLILTPTGLFLIEIKSRPGVLEGDAHTWTWRAEGRVHSDDNPVILANRKARKLASLLRNQRAFNTLRTPYLDPLVFCSAPGLVCRLQGPAGQRVHLRERVSSEGLASRLGIIDVLTTARPPAGAEARGNRIDLRVARALSQAMEQAGIRTSQRSRRVGDYILGQLLFDGPGYQDWEATHVSLRGVRRRVRLYPVAMGAGGVAREGIQRAAEREFRILEGIQHPGILRAVDYTEHERGPALIFEQDPRAVRLDHYLIEHGVRLSLDVRLGLVRQIAETVRFAHEKRLVHRALSPQSILILDPTSPSPRIQIFNWQTGVRHAGSSTPGSPGVSATSHLGMLVEDAATVYLAPEALNEGEGGGETADIFSLGALAYHLFSGQSPATSIFELAEKLREGKGLRISTVLNGAGRALQDLIQLSTHPEVTSRLGSADDFLELLTSVEEELTRPEPDGLDDPTEAKAGDRLRGGFVVRKRLGKGSCAVALLVERDGHEYVLKVANDPQHNERLRGEADVLGKLRHQHIVELYDTLELGGRVGLLMQKAGDQTLAQRLRAEGRLHLDLLQRFGEDLIQTVDWLEQHGIPHRDIKPDNIGVSPVGRGDRLHLVLFDFSLSRTPAELLRAGTVPYLDPFLASRRPPRWDLHAERFAVAMTLYEMTTGTLPRWGDGRSEPAVLDCEVTLDAELFDPNLRDAMTAFFATALQRDYRARFDNGEEMLRAWRRIFVAIDQPAPWGRSEGDASALIDIDARLQEATLETLITDLGLSTRATNALDRRNVLTVRDLLRVPLVRIYQMPGVGHKTRREMVEALRVLARRLPDPVGEGETVIPPAPPGAGDLDRPSVDVLVRRLLPRPSAAGRSDDQVVRLFLGLGERMAGERTGWPSQSDVAGWVGLTRARVSQLVTAIRARWSRDRAVTRLRQELVEILDTNGGVMTARELAVAILTARGSVQDEPVRQELALAVARAAVETERERAEPRFTVRRSGDHVLVARTPEMAEYAEQLGKVADRLAEEDPLPSPARVLETLQRVGTPTTAVAVPPTRLARLAAAASSRAAVSSRLELYPRSMPALRALRLAHGAVLGPDMLTVAELRERVAGRYPEAQPLPGRPELDALIGEAGWDFEWIHEGASGQGAYRTRPRPAPGSGSISALDRLTTSDTPPAVITPEVADARQFEARLQHATRHGAFLALTVEPKYLGVAERELTRRFPVEPGSLEAMLLRHMKEEAARAGADWAVVLRADAAARDSREWQNLRFLVGRAVPALEQEIVKVGAEGRKTVLLSYPGLLARYDHLDLLGRLRDRVGHPGGIPGLWVLIAADAQQAAPVIDGRIVPVITRGEWARIPEPWLRNLHRAPNGPVEGPAPTPPDREP